MGPEVAWAVASGLGGLLLGQWLGRRRTGPELEWLRRQLERQVDHEERVERRKVGLPELAPRRPEPEDPVPDHVVALAEMMGSGVLGTAKLMHRRGASWQHVERWLVGEANAQVPGLGDQLLAKATGTTLAREP